MRFVSAYITTAAVFLALDMAWLGIFANSFYRGQMGPILAQPFNSFAATAFYILFVLGALIFAVQPAISSGGGIPRALWLGALFGFFTYMTYNLTGLAVIREFPAKLALVDIAWGTVATTIAAAAGTAVGSRF